MAKSKEVVSIHPLFDDIKHIYKNIEKDWDLSLIPHTRKEAFDWMLKEMSTCTNCILSETRNKVVLPDGDLNSEIMIIFQNPSFNEDLTGMPITGLQEIVSSDCGYCTKVKKCFEGRLLNRVDGYMSKTKPIICKPDIIQERTIPSNVFLKSTGSIFDGILAKKHGLKFPRLNWIKDRNKNGEMIGHTSPFFITNTVLCRSTDSSRSKDIEVATVPKSRCKPWLMLQWAIVRPKVIICFGQEALKSITKNYVSINEFCETPYGKVLYNKHPAFIMRELNKENKSYGYASIGETIDIALREVGLI